jgi:CheY-like chemotaxis protein
MYKKVALIVDDEPDIIQHVGSILTSWGFEVISADCGKEAVQLAIENKPSLIILDVFLPDIDGGAVANQLAQRPDTKDIPIIYLTGLVTKSEKSVPQKMGEHFLIAKPVLKGELLAIVNKALR